MTLTAQPSPDGAKLDGVRAEAPRTQEPVDALPSTGEIVLLKQEKPPVKIACRSGRRLGFHAVAVPDWIKEVGGTLRPGAVVGVDCLLRELRCPSADQHVLVFADPEAVDLEALLRARSTSAAAIRLGEGAKWLLDLDQVAGLRGAGYDLAERPDAPSVCERPGSKCTCLSRWNSRAYNLTNVSGPGESTEELASGKQIRYATVGDVPVMSKWDSPTHGDASRPADENSTPGEVVARTTADDAGQMRSSEFVARASSGSGRGLPGVELSSLDNGTPAVHAGDWLCASHKFSSESGPKTLALPVAVRPTTDSRGRSLYLPRASNKTPPDLPVDQVVRLALGIGVHETYQVTEFGEQRKAGWNQAPRARRTPTHGLLFRLVRSVLQWLMPTVNIVARVQPAELTLTEQNACLLSPLALDAMGISSGDEVIVRAASTNEAGAAIMTTKTIKAYAPTEDVLNRRLATYGGNRSAPLPSEEEALGVPQALPWIWLDAHVREQLGLKGPLTSVVVHPSRWFVVKDHSRELAVAAVVGGLTLGAEADGWATVCWVGGSLFLALFLVAVRVRSKLR